MDFTSPIKSIKKTRPKSTVHKSVLSPNTLDRIARPRRHELSPTPFPIMHSRKTFKSTPKKHKPSKTAGVLKRLQKTEVNITRTVPCKKVKKAGSSQGRVGNTFGCQKPVEPTVMNVDDRAKVQVHATPAPKNRVTL